MMPSEISEVMRPIRADYYTRVRELAVEACKLPEDEQGDWLHEQIDGSHWIIYTHSAAALLMVSDEDDAAADELGEDEARTLTVGQRAYYAFRADVQKLMVNPYFQCDQDGETDDAEGEIDAP